MKTRRRRPVRHFRTDVVETIAAPVGGRVGEAQALLAELHLDEVGVTFVGGKLDVGGRRYPSDDQYRRVARLHDEIVGLVPFGAPIRWPSPRDIGERLASDILRQLGLRASRSAEPMAYVAYWRLYPTGFISGVWS